MKMFFSELFIVSVLFLPNGLAYSGSNCSGELDFMERAIEVDECVAEFQEDAYTASEVQTIRCPEFLNLTGCGVFMNPCYSTHELLNTLIDPLRYAIAKRTTMRDDIKACAIGLLERNNSCSDEMLWANYENIASCRASIISDYLKATTRVEGCQLVVKYADDCLASYMPR